MMAHRSSASAAHISIWALIVLGNSRHISVAIAGMLAVLGVLACNADRLPTSPRARPSGALVVADSQAFYYSSDGTPIYLTPDPEEVVFTTSTPAAANAVTAMAASLNLSTSGVDALPQLANHWHLRLPTGTGLAAALALRSRLKADGRFGFVSTAYRQVGDTASMLLVDRAIVRFKAGVTPQQVDSLVAALGMRIIRPPRPDSG